MLTEYPVLQYLAYTLGATFWAVMFSLAVENWKEEKYKYVYAVVISVILTPFGAWVISTFARFHSAEKKFGTLA